MWSLSERQFLGRARNLGGAIRLDVLVARALGRPTSSVTRMSLGG